MGPRPGPRPINDNENRLRAGGVKRPQNRAHEILANDSLPALKASI